MKTVLHKLYRYVWKEPRVGAELVLRRFSPLLSDKLYLSLLFRFRMGYWMDWNDPQTFSEKMQWLKLYDRKAEYVTMVDKYEAKRYIAGRVGDAHLIPTLGGWDRTEDITFDALPDQYVLKTTHDCGGVVVCDKRVGIDESKIRTFLEQHLKRNYFRYNREWPYKGVIPRIMAEMRIGVPGQDLIDYKFFCFQGIPKLCQVIRGRNSIMTVDFYDEEWNRVPFQEPLEYDRSETPCPKPESLSEMLSLATKLSQGFPFLRVDLYDVAGKVYCGELTFFPTSGLGGFNPTSYDMLLGSWINLPEKKDN